MGSVAFTTFNEWIIVLCCQFFQSAACLVFSPLMYSSCLQLLEQENTRIELEMKDLLNELNRQKDQNDLMSEKIVQLEVNSKYSKVFSFFFLLT